MISASSTQTLDKLIAASPKFQRAVNLRFALHDADLVERYIPTFNATTAIDAVIRGIDRHGTQRAHVIHAAYGSGKSLLAVALAALLENTQEMMQENTALVQRISDVDPEIGKRVHQHLYSTTRRALLPVVLSGDEGDFSTALTRALMRSLNDFGLYSVTPQTRFNAAIRTLDDWEANYQSTWESLNQLAKRTPRKSAKHLKKELQQNSLEAYTWFEQIYTQLTSGAIFDRFAEKSPELVFLDVVKLVRGHGYSGIVVLWDEFGRYLESRASQAFSSEVAQLQAFAEACNHSGSDALHLVLFTHKEVQSYASSLPKSFQQEWARIEGRFQNHNVTGDPHIAYRLVATAIQHNDHELALQIAGQENLDALVSYAVDARLFGVLTVDEVRAIIQRTWPLHPLTVFALTRLSNRVAQNERTLFTFLTVDEPRSLVDVLRQIQLNDDDLLVRPPVIWNYFSDAIRSNMGVGGVHHIWSGVTHALDKLLPGDVLEEALIKTLGVLTICSDASVARPTTDLLCWAVGARTDEEVTAVVTSLDNLRRRKVIIRRQVDGFWSFTSGSDIDFERKVEEILERTNPTPLQLRRLLEQINPAPYTLARRYNQQTAMTRYFTGLYRWVDELDGVSWEDALKDQNNADGLVVYILAHDDESLHTAALDFPSNPQIVFVLPEQPMLSLNDTLREVFGLLDLKDEPELQQHDDRDRIQRELTWLLEDAVTRLQRELQPLIAARDGQTEWVFRRSGNITRTKMMSPGHATKIVSDICADVFPATPVINSEGLNKRLPTGQQIAASQKVIDALFGPACDATLGLEGNGADVAALNSLLGMTGILRPSADGEQWVVDAPEDERHFQVWERIDQFFNHIESYGRQPLSVLLSQLIAPPFGMRLGVLPILFSAVLRKRVKATTIREGERAIHPISGRLITEMFARPDEYTIEIGEWSDVNERLWQALFAKFSGQIHESEREQQPLTILKISMLRWLQSLPAFCRDTQNLTPQALKFRNLIRMAQSDPAKVLFVDLPKLLEIADDTEPDEIARRLDQLTSEISNAYFDLQRRLESFAIEHFGVYSVSLTTTGASALRGWINTLQSNQQAQLKELRFGSLVAQQVAETILLSTDGDDQFWDRLSRAATGLHIRDWNDQSETKFRQTLLNTRVEIEREAEELVRGETVISVQLQLPKAGQKDFRFRASDLTSQGKRLLQNFKSTLDIAGRPLSADEKRQIVVAFLCYVMGEAIDE